MNRTAVKVAQAVYLAVGLALLITGGVLLVRERPHTPTPTYTQAQVCPTFSPHYRTVCAI